MAVNDLNLVILTGRLTADPLERSEGKIAAFAIAVNRFYYKGDERVKETLFIDVSAFGYEAAAVQAKLSKGDEITVEGRLELNEWVDVGTQTKRQKIRLVAQRIHSPKLRQKGEKESEPPLANFPPHPSNEVIHRTEAGDDIPF